MKLKALRYRQIHLDFHTSPHIPGIGGKFDAKQFVETLRRAAVDSVTLFAKCHHGWSYHPTSVGKQHPGLKFDLLRAQYDALKEADIQCPIYLSAGLDNLVSYEHPEWREITVDGAYAGWTKRVIDPGFHFMDFHSPYLAYLCEQIREVAGLFPGCDGIFLDIIMQNQSCSRWSLDFMLENGLDPEREPDRRKSSELALLKYYEQTTAAAQSGNPGMPVFHNAGHISRGAKDILKFFSHLELESLPTGGWGYDHFPMSAKYTCNLPLDMLGMTGKFHTTWGEFGGFKHPNALRYECAAMLAYGAKCSVGDQLHPGGGMDRSTYEIIGEAYREVALKEAWCVGASQVSDLAVISAEAERHDRAAGSVDEGVTRALLEEHFLFGLIDRDMDFSPYRALILPDILRIDEELKAKLDRYLGSGGRLILSGDSGLWKDREEFAFDIGATHHGLSPYLPDFILPVEGLRPDFVRTPHVMYQPSRRIKAAAGQSLGDVYDPYFNRTYRHFCSHQHAPSQIEPSGFSCGVRHGNILYFAHPVFTNYRALGAVACRQFLSRAIRWFLGDVFTISTNLPSTARLTLTRQPLLGRSILHLLYAPTINRGGAMSHSGGNVAATAKSVEVIEDLLPLTDVDITLSPRHPVSRITLEPQGQPLPMERNGTTIKFSIPRFTCHQMVVLHES